MRMKISDAAAASGCHLETIRFYERIALVPVPARTPSGYRRYERVDVERLRFVARARDLGFSLDQIRELLALSCSDPEADCEEVSELARRHLREVEARVADLQRIAAELRRTIDGCRNGSKATCTILDALQVPAPAARRQAAP